MQRFSCGTCATLRLIGVSKPKYLRLGLEAAVPREQTTMASIDDVYKKFGIAAEAAQLLETELSTLLLGIRGLEQGWHISPDPKAGQKVLAEIDSQTLGAVLKRLRETVQFDDQISEKLASALRARNRLMHGFYERHNFKMQADEGRDAVVADLEILHAKLFAAWQLAGVMSHLVVQAVVDQQAKHEPGPA